MIRKEGKARWTYTCKLCRKTWAKPDQFRAIERQQRHLRSTAHMVEGISVAFKPAAEVIRNLGLAFGWAHDSSLVARAMAQEHYALAPPFIPPRRRSEDAEGA